MRASFELENPAPKASGYQPAQKADNGYSVKLLLGARYWAASVVTEVERRLSWITALVTDNRRLLDRAEPERNPGGVIP